jgi:hypothetical protein
MGMFYDPIKKRPQTWVIVSFIVVPILIIVIGYITGHQYAKEKNQIEKDLTPDEFFDTFKK